MIDTVLSEKLALALVKYKGRFDSMQELADRLVEELELTAASAPEPDYAPDYWGL